MDESMIYPQPPHLELNFYFADDVHNKGFITLFQSLLYLGAVYWGEVVILKAEDAEEQHFNGHPTNVTRMRASSDEVLELGRTEGVRLICANFNNAIGLSKRGEYVRYARISDRAAQSDHPPLQIVTSGYVFDLIPEFEQEARVAAKKVYRRFVELIEHTHPSYASVSSEYDMECPADLREKAASKAFGTVYLDTDYVGSEGVTRVKKAFNGAYIEEIGNGVLFSSWIINPKGKKLTKDEINLQRIDQVVAEVIAGRF